MYKQNHKPRENSEIQEKCTDIILNNLDNSALNVPFLAREMGISQASLYRKLKAYSGLSSSAFIRKVKLDKALDLLVNSEATITEIAIESGFSTIAYFDKCFREHFGQTPSQVRKSHGNIVAGMQAGIDKEHIKGKDTDKKMPSANQLYHIPEPHTSFIGRKKEISEITLLLNTHRLISIIGPGGSGKTRLACEVVNHLSCVFEDGIWFVNLAPVECGDFVVKRIMEALNIPEIPGKELPDALLKGTQDKSILILLDNCEHVISRCREVCSMLLQKTKDVKMLTTSRVTLNVSGEQTWHIQPLGMPRPGKSLEVELAKTSDAIRLFEDRAQLSDKRFVLSNDNVQHIAGICSKLDAIPLALELVAGHIRYLDPRTLLKRLFEKPSLLSSPYSDTIDRHKTLWSTFDWSYNLLKENEKELFRRLSLFPGGCTLDAAEEVCSDESIQSEDILDLVTVLVDHSLVSTVRNQGEDLRYIMLEPLRQYAAEKMDPARKQTHMGRMLEYYTSLSDKAYRERISSQAYWMKKLHKEQDNFMEVLSWSESSNPEAFYRLAASIAWFWARSNNYAYALPLLERIVDEKKISDEYRARVLPVYSRMLVEAQNGSLDQALVYLTEASDLWSALDRSNEVAIALAETALVYCNIDHDTALEYALKGYEQAKIAGEPAVLLQCMISLSQVYVGLRNTNEARRVARKILLAAKQLDNLYALFAGHHHLADCDLMEGKYAESEREYAEGVKTSRMYGDIVLTNIDLFGIAMSLGGQGRYVKALRIYGAVLESAKRSALAPPENLQMNFWQEAFNKTIIVIREKLGEKVSEMYISDGSSMSLDEVVVYALDVEKD